MLQPPLPLRRRRAWAPLHHWLPFGESRSIHLLLIEKKNPYATYFHLVSASQDRFTYWFQYLCVIWFFICPLKEWNVLWMQCISFHLVSPCVFPYNFCKCLQIEKKIGYVALIGKLYFPCISYNVLCGCCKKYLVCLRFVENVFYMLHMVFIIIFWLDLLGGKCVIVQLDLICYVSCMIFITKFFDLSIWFVRFHFLQLKLHLVC